MVLHRETLSLVSGLATLAEDLGHEMVFLDSRALLSEHPEQGWFLAADVRAVSLVGLSAYDDTERRIIATIFEQFGRAPDLIVHVTDT